MPELALTLLRFALVVPAIILHEVSHGYVAYLLGDSTAKERGRLTLSPLAHVDLWGTVLMPVLMLVMSGGSFAFGYAKPVPVDPRRMYKVGPRTGMLLTGIAGPATNIALAVVAAVIYRVLGLVPSVPAVVDLIVYFFVYINLLLAFFNLIPIPPLDGSRVVQRFLKGQALQYYASLERYGMLIVLLLVFILPQFTSLDPVGWFIRATVVPVASVLLGS
jgi:Zn-dependent protease